MAVLSCAGNLKEVVELRMIFSWVLFIFIFSTGCLSMFVTHTETHPGFVFVFEGEGYFSTPLKSSTIIISLQYVFDKNDIRYTHL